MDSTQIRSTFLDFYTSRGHRPITGSTLLPPPGDPVLYTTSGMHPLTPYVEGRPHPDGTPAGQPAALPAHHRPRRGRRSTPT